MRKVTLAVTIIFVGFASAIAQPKLGLKFSPIFASSGIDLDSDTLDMTSTGSEFRFSIGLIADQELTDTYYLSTGLIFLPKRLTFDLEAENGGTIPANPSQSYDINYLQVPVSLKLYTNEVAPDLGIFFQVGMAAEFKIYDRPLEEEYDFINQFNFFDTSVILGLGGEYAAGINTVLFFGGSYQKGLINAVKETTPFLGDDVLTVRNGVISIDLGIKF